MTREEIETLADNLTEEYERYKDDLTIKNYIKRVIEITNLYWQEKTRWKSLEKEPPSELQYDKMYLLRTESGSPYLSPLPYKESIKEFISYGFIEWKEID